MKYFLHLGGDGKGGLEFKEHSRNMKSICYILSYRAPNYVRTTSLLNALYSMEGIEVCEARNTSKGLYRYFQTIWKLLLTRLTKDPQIYILGFRGYEIFPLVRIITLGKPLIYDHMMSPYDSLLSERKVISKGTLLDKFVFLYEQAILNLADVILADTNEHKQFFQNTFGIRPEKIHAVPVGTDEDLFNEEYPASQRESKPFEVFFYGTFLPLHGIDIILNTARALKDMPIIFRIVGGEQKNAEMYRSMISSENLDNIIYGEWLDFEELPSFITQADLCLGGPFGNTGQAHRVITGKTSQFLAMAKPTVIGRTGEECGFIDRENCLLVNQGDERELTEAILWAYENQGKLHDIGLKGCELFRKKFSTEIIADMLQGIIEQACLH